MTMSLEGSQTLRLRICQWCPMCKQFVKDRRFKNHLLTHWVKGGGVGARSNEEYADFIRRIFKCKVKIPFELLNE